ncbi:MAG TPA: hypothetical protein VHE33_13685 [Acidobacteriaceae bacterium]|nr:hypothetical protein [Acidobacteriaceae bacterium]
MMRIQESKRHRERFRNQSGGGSAPHFFLTSGSGHFCRQIPQSAAVAIVENTLGCFQCRNQHTAYAPIVCGRWTVGKGEIALFQIVVAVQNEQLIGNGEILAAGHHIVEVRPYEVHCFGEDLADGTA